MATEALYSRKNPFPAPVLGVRRLTGEGSPKETIHIEFSLEDSGLEYAAGDALGVVPCNDPALVDALIDALRLDPAEVLSVDGENKTLREALIADYDITALSKAALAKWLAAAPCPLLAEVLEDKCRLKDFCWGRDFLDLAQKQERRPFADGASFSAILKRLGARLYSIASSPKAHPGQVHLCVGAVRYTTDGRKRGGVCSTYMADRLQPGDTARVFVHSNKNFRLPEDPAVPIIMVGPGTGIAPFRSFWEERIASRAAGGNWLFFGNPYKATDFCYEDELAPLVGSGRLKLSAAWSRDQAYKIYVQNLMEQSGEEIWQWLEQGAHFYMCGDANRMAKDVEKTLLSLAARYGGRSEEEAAAWLSAMKSAGRYQKDVY